MAHITPRIFAEDPESLVELVKLTFGATGDYQTTRPSELRIGDSMLMISGTEFRRRQTACLYVYVSDVDEAFEKSVNAGVKVIEAPANMSYGTGGAPSRTAGETCGKSLRAIPMAGSSLSGNWEAKGFNASSEARPTDV